MALKDEIKQRVEMIFADSGISNVRLVDGEQAGDTNVYFASPTPPDIAGFALRCDQFNVNREDSAIVYFFGNGEIDAEVTAHEIDHMFGLNHVNPSSAADPSNLSVMDYDGRIGDRERFINAVSEVFVPSRPVIPPAPPPPPPMESDTHNPVYHLERYVDGETDSALAARGILPGSWDLMASSTAPGVCSRVNPLSLDFSGSGVEIFDVSMLSGPIGGPEAIVEEIAHFDSIRLSDLEAMSWGVEAGHLVEVLAASAPGGPLDLVLATGDPFDSSTHGVLSLVGRQDVFLQLATGADNFSTLATGAATFAPEPTSIGLLLIAVVTYFRRRPVTQSR